MNIFRGFFRGSSADYSCNFGNLDARKWHLWAYELMQNVVCLARGLSTDQGSPPSWTCCCHGCCATSYPAILMACCGLLGVCLDANAPISHNPQYPKSMLAAPLGLGTHASSVPSCSIHAPLSQVPPLTRVGRQYNTRQGNPSGPTRYKKHMLWIKFPGTPSEYFPPSPTPSTR